ncbi:CHAT domain-containing protein [Scytonema sp. NUACC26]|uniref:CHAT domain-containing protein n=1 Tax=Scytonema sp. NUACC26 TaxID=3140176 RepID=UPI0034DC3C90
MQQKVLLLTAIPRGLRLNKEIREIEEAFRRAAKRDNLEISLRTAVRPQDIRRAIAEERPSIVHFCGHGLEDGSLVLEDNEGNNKEVTPEGLAQLFKLHKDYVKCVLLNACHSAQSATAIHQYINCVIGMNQAIQDQAAIAFSQGFYDTLGYEYPDNNLNIFQRAFDEALVALQLENISQGQIPVLMLNQPSTPLPGNDSLMNNPPIETNQELDDRDMETLRELLQLSGRAAADRRKALCIEIGINSGDLSAIWILAENDFAVELVDLLQKRKLQSSIYKLCQKLASDFKGGGYYSKLRAIMAKINPE